MYFSYHVSDDIDSSSWIYALTDQTRLTSLILQEITIKDFIENAESSFKIKVKNEDILEVTAYFDSSILPDTYLE